MPRKRRPEGTRAPNGASSIYYSETDGYWHGRVTMGVRDDGKPDRRHVQAKTETEVIDKVRKLERDRDSGNARKPGRAWTVEKWLTHWVENIAVHSVRYKTLQGYRTAVYKHLIPGIGAHRMDRIEPEHFERFYARMQAAGASAGTAHQVHRTAKTAFNEYFRRQRITGNPIAFVKAPRVEEKEVEPFTPQEAKSIITAALKRRNGVRYVVALALGCRQGEALGFKWDRLDRGNRLYRVRQALQRQAWQHGCDDPHACGARLHRVACPDNCTQHRNRKSCIRDEKGHHRPCPPNCTRHASSCPQRHGGGLVEVDVKSKAGRRSFVLPDEVFDLLMRHEQAQQRERKHAGSEWQEGGWVFTQPNGRPIDPRRDWGEWKDILGEAGVRDARLHDARHTAATVLMLLRVPDRAVQDHMGWSSIRMKERYMHVTEELRREIADQLNGYFWDVN
ncbi:integrase-like protein [Saccharopolyspora erythraea NRRL 2338]|uniref:Integrase (Recombinase) n=2 Tax=Saccharopolyspora erythraea TaxID=1836 RepID=A4F6Y8_SACEN|nr:tyrosine-type recombinase/integrase [Saccharopolyspora erythraea]AAA26480.1 integrase [Saccharopolyspora erythraea]EQD85467.1 integrase [Saccharopolyspora erythraea D]PFG93613.1 integrase-like protein [Saccharopolyspora erythraea NRRL 2338]QRK90245.1 tyrosine-type recombinase/integrase [Saccharopolyspora erythraea]QRK90461.1 tyrosine-type recombinase/integrase [Saccharopolyspora erythraea]